MNQRISPGEPDYSPGFLFFYLALRMAARGVMSRMQPVTISDSRRSASSSSMTRSRASAISAAALFSTPDSGARNSGIGAPCSR
nr:MAG TPA: hypothetical protein [Caudoviricetes sp.]